MDPLLQEAVRAGRATLLDKPFTLAALTRAVRDRLDGVPSPSLASR